MKCVTTSLLVSLTFFGMAQKGTINSQNTLRSRLNPTAQFAGGIGMGSLGCSHTYSKKKLESQILLGYVPKSKAGKTLWILTLKQAYFPVKTEVLKRASKTFILFPLSVGGSLSIYNLSSENTNELPFHQNSMMYNYFLGGKIDMELKEATSRFISFYYEIGSNYIETYTYYLNKSTIRFHETLNIGFGVSIDL